MITNLDHVQLAMPPDCEEQARAFFGELLGMQEDAKPAVLAGRGGCWFRAGAAVLHVGVEKDFVPQRKAHPAFGVRDIDGFAAHLAAAGVAVQWDDSLPERRRLYATDPFGNRIEFISEGDGFADLN